MNDVTRDDHLEAERIATAAGALLVTVRAELTATGADSRTLKDEGDRRSHEFIMAELARVRPDDAVLSEEGKDDLARLERDRQEFQHALLRQIVILYFDDRLFGCA